MTAAPGSSNFASLPLSPALLESVGKLGYGAMTPIQAAALPMVLAGHDVIAQAKTGSGKTAAFGLGLLQKLKPNASGGRAPQALILCPTRELADQVAREVRSLASAIPNVKVVTLCGGVPIRTHRDTLEHGADVVVGTPGRLRALIEKKSLLLDALQTVVLDEADRMLDMGFEDDLRAILEHGAVVDTSSPLTAARTNLAGPLLRWVLFPHHVNYHIEHHLFPAVPHYHLPRLHRELAARGVLRSAEVRQPGQSWRLVYADRHPT